MGEVLGKHPHFLSGSQVRELALAPGSTLYRILTDPATGRYVERSTTAYRFDKAMRTHIAYADLTCRAPGCTVPATQCQFDHVQEFGTPGGDTCEANGALAHAGDHQKKTEKLWDAIIHANRDLTWTTLLGRIYRTKAHDYTQYDKLLTAAIDVVAQADPEDRPAAIDQVIYTALSHRPPRQSLEAADDYYEPDAYPAWDLITLTHTDNHGQRRHSPDPLTAAAEAARMAWAAEATDQDPQTPHDSKGEDGRPHHGMGRHDHGRDPGRTRGTNPWDQPPTEPPPF